MRSDHPQWGPMAPWGWDSLWLGFWQSLATYRRGLPGDVYPTEVVVAAAVVVEVMVVAQLLMSVFASKTAAMRVTGCSTHPSC